MQTAYRIVVESNGVVIWDSGRVESERTSGIVYKGPNLCSRRRYEWKVKVWDNQGRESDWSNPAFWEMGLLKPEDWEAHWIEPIQKPASEEKMVSVLDVVSGNVATKTLQEQEADLRPPQLIRRAFRVVRSVRKARLYITSRGVYRAEINGMKVGQAEFSPDFTPYDKYLKYQTYDVTACIKPGVNAIGIVLADGWYIGRIHFAGHSCHYGNKLALLLQLEIEYEDGSTEVISTDTSFRCHTGPWLYADLFIGEKYDARLEIQGWSSPDFDDSEWFKCVYSEDGPACIRAQYGPVVRAMERLSPIQIYVSSDGSQIVDFGQVIAGRIRLRLNVPEGTEIRIEHSEAVDTDGQFIRNIVGRNKEQTDIYITSGRGDEVYEPAFTYHGFRYVRITGCPTRIQLDDVEAVVLYSDMKLTGSFRCSDERLNRLHSNIQWTQKSNMVSIPTDCPTRERAGWTGDVQVFAPTATFNMHVFAFLRRWLLMVRLEQLPDGRVPNHVPAGRYLEFESGPLGISSAGWGDAIIIVPWVLYQRYGDISILEENYEAMGRWLSYVRSQAEQESDGHRRYLWNHGFHFGDWMIPSLVMENNNGLGPIASAEATGELVATCFYAYSCKLMSEIADIIGRPGDAVFYRQLYSHIRQAFEKEYVDDSGRLSAHFQGTYVLALYMDMVSSNLRGRMVEQLVRLIECNGWRLDTGFLATPFLMDVLCDAGRPDIAYRLLWQERCPSWLYEINCGATTVWESWDAVSPNGDVKLVSQNHVAFGCIGDWMYRRLGGLKPLMPGFKEFIVEPDVMCGLDFVGICHDTPYGIIKLEWRRSMEIVNLSLRVPANTHAIVRVSAKVLHIDVQQYVLEHRVHSGVHEVLLGSGDYHIVVELDDRVTLESAT
ncbi:alpha-L-rhamnosidase [Alicyclobacillus vulcanalis]|uniref:alpha-L-rhamnosidase n=1 Tax=Alicyclobacillus vulcanalis TaxID=252246 RepID=A0A1N7NXI6_9BACL|nr:alpha-L-rhamnosidase [Alicyclobacillus vulcanalis]